MIAIEGGNEGGIPLLLAHFRTLVEAYKRRSIRTDPASDRRNKGCDFPLILIGAAAKYGEGEEWLGKRAS